MLSDILATYMFFPAVSETTDLYMVSEYNVSTVTSHICDDDHLYTYLFFFLKRKCNSITLCLHARQQQCSRYNLEDEP